MAPTSSGFVGIVLSRFVRSISARGFTLPARCLCAKAETWTEPNGFDTGVKVHNSLCHKGGGDSLVPLILPHGKTARWYACGPTVYDSAHLGHASSCVRFDIIRRILESFFNIRVVQVMGITDIDDKIIARANQTGENFRSLARREEKKFLEDMATMKVLPASHYSRVTDHIPSIRAFISRIMNNGYAYATTSGSVYFDVKSFGLQRYGKLHHPASDDDGSKDSSSEKRSPQDFALWKSAKRGEPWWESPWGKGRPGWHIECSAMSSTIFGESLDIHTGGIDLLFPHHTNEIAQCEGCFQRDQWANYFLHAGHLFLKKDADKMSKSIGNVIGIPEFLQTYSSNHFRVLCLLMRYRHNIEYSEDALHKAVRLTNQITSFLSDCEAYMSGQVTGGAVAESLAYQRVDEASQKVRQAFADDFDTPRALEALMDLIRETNSQMQPSSQSCPHSARSPVAVGYVSSFVASTLSSLGFDLHTKESVASSTRSHLSSTLDALVTFRDEVRGWALSTDGSSKAAGETAKELKKRLQHERAPLLKACDDVRTKLAADNIQMKDRGGVTTWEFMDRKVNQNTKDSENER